MTSSTLLADPLSNETIDVFYINTLTTHRHMNVKIVCFRLLENPNSSVIAAQNWFFLQRSMWTSISLSDLIFAAAELMQIQVSSDIRLADCKGHSQIGIAWVLKVKQPITWTQTTVGFGHHLGSFVIRLMLAGYFVCYASWVAWSCVCEAGRRRRSICKACWVQSRTNIIWFQNLCSEKHLSRTT